MPVSDFECQIARGQIGRYLDGGVLSPEAMKGLEEHLAECPPCKAMVARRRAELLSKLDGDAPTHAVVPMPASAPAPKENPLVAALRAREAAAPVEEPKRPASAPRYASAAPRYATQLATKSDLKPGAKPPLTKPLLLGAVLAVVLIAMNAMTRGNGGKGVLGDRASDSFAAQRFASPAPKPSEPVETSPKPDSTLPKAIAPSSEAPPAAPKAETVPSKTVATSTAPPILSKAPAPATTPSVKPAALTSGTKPVSPSTETKTAVPPSVEKKPEARTAPAVEKPKPTLPVASKPEKPLVKPVAKTTVVHRAFRPRAVRRPTEPRVARRSAIRPTRPQKAPAVRVYAPDGKPLNP